MEPGNTRTVYVVQVDYNKDVSDAKRFGSLRAVFGSARKPYDTPALIAKARRVLSNWNPGDYLLMIGDPVLCAVCMALVAERYEDINVLSWDRNTFQYMPQYWNFGQMELPFDDNDFDTVD